MIRLALVPILAFALVVSVGDVARAETDEEQVADPGTELFRQALSEYRTALAELRELCAAGDEDAGVSTARRRAPKTMSACERGMKELRSFLVEVRKTAHLVREQHALDKEARRVAKEEERAAKEREDAETAEKAEKAKRDDAARQAEKVKQAERSKKRDQQKTSDASKQKASYERELAELRTKLQAELNDWAKGERAANEYRLLAATKAGEERAKYEQKAVSEKQHAAEHQATALKLQAKIAEYERGLSSLPKSTELAKDLARKAQKLRDQIRSLEGTIAYKRGLEQDALDRAGEYRAIAAEKAGAEREKYLYKAAEMDRQADEWARYAADYEEQLARAQAELDSLGL